MRSTGVRREESRIYLDGPTENIETIDHFFHSQHPRLLCSDEEILCPRQGTIMLSATLSLKGEIDLNTVMCTLTQWSGAWALYALGQVTLPLLFKLPFPPLENGYNNVCSQCCA